VLGWWLSQDISYPTHNSYPGSAWFMTQPGHQLSYSQHVSRKCLVHGSARTSVILLTIHIQEVLGSWPSQNISYPTHNSYPGSAWFMTQPRHQLSYSKFVSRKCLVHGSARTSAILLGFFVVFYSSTRQILG
jgi:hypothetical protein